MTARKHAQIARMMARDPHCHWCGREVVWFHPGPNKRRTRLPGNFATRDHLNSRNQSVPRPALGEIVLACLDCNNARAAAEVAAMPVEELRRRAGMHPCACGCGGMARADFAYKRGHGDNSRRAVAS